MKISLNNIGKIKSADIEIGGIAVIAGENDTGKSTIAKSLYSIINAFYDIDEKIQQDKFDILDEVVREMSYELLSGLPSTTQRRILAHRAIYQALKKDFSKNIKNINTLKNIIVDKSLENGIKANSEIVDKYIKKINQIMSISNKEMQNETVKKQFDLEFSGEINNAYSDDPGILQLNLKAMLIEIYVKNNVVNVKKAEPNIFANAIYIDNSLIVDNIGAYFMENTYQKDHKDMLEMMLLNKNDNIARSIILTEQFQDIYELMNSVVSGKLDINDDDNCVYKNKDGITLSMTNVSAGLKTFIIIKTLFLNGYIKENGILILDEPEIHLHPKLQLVFAELIVLLQKEFSLHILLSTHSPYFLKAIEVYSKKHEISDKCKYYLTKSLDNEKKSIEVENVTDKTYEIYKLLAEPYNALHETENKIDEA